jgi:hypothetical protein
MLDIGVDLEGGVEDHLAFRCVVLLRDAGRTGHAQLGFGGGVGEGLAHAVVDHFVLHRVAIALRHHRHRHLAGSEAVGLDRARQVAQAVLDFAVDGRRPGSVIRRSSFSRVSTLTAMMCGIDKDSGWCAGPDSNRHAGEGVRT